MLSKKTSTESTSTKIGAVKNKKRKESASFDFSGFQDEIRVQAYYNYLKRVKNNIPGSEVSDWVDAEKSVRSKMSTH